VGAKPLLFFLLFPEQPLLLLLLFGARPGGVIGDG
jgi:hypothetical protein